MKKLLLLALVMLGGVMQASAQHETSGSIRVAFTDPTNTWTQSKFFIYVFSTSTNNNDTWPGVDVTNNTVVIDGNTYYYRDFDISEYGSGFKCVAVNQDENGGNESKSIDFDWSYDRSSITGDSYYSLISDWTDSKRKADLVTMYYVVNSSDVSKIKMVTKSTDGSNTNYSVSFNTTNYPAFVIANSYAFTTSSGDLNWDANPGGDNKPYPNNIYRPNYSKSLSFANISENVTDNSSEFWRYRNSGCWDASGIPSVNIDFTFSINSSWNPTTYTISPSFTRTISSEFTTFSSDYNVGIPPELKAYYAATTTTQNNNTRVNMTMFNNGIRSVDGALIQVVNATNDNKYTFTPATTTDTPSQNLLKPVTAGTIEAGKYVLANQNGLGFYEVQNTMTDNSLNGKAYLDTPANGARLAIAFDDEITGINSIETTKDAEGYYDLQGRRVAQPSKGLYIVNGKKFIK